MTNFSRIDYTKTDGKPSSAYYDSLTQKAFDVYSREPVTLVQDHLWQYHELNPTVNEKVGQNKSEPKPTTVIVKQAYSLWTVIPIGLFGLAMIWLELTFL